jgi:hypothetical protein
MPDHAWSTLLPHLRGALQDVVDEALTPPLRRLRAAPMKRLREGRVRRDLERALVDGGALWVAFRKRLAEDHLARQHWGGALSAEAPSVDPVGFHRAGRAVTRPRLGGPTEGACADAQAGT